MGLSERIRPDVEAAPWVIDEIKKLENEVELLQNRMCHLASVQHLNTVKIFEAGPLEAALARIEELEDELKDWQRYCGIILREHST